MKRWLLIVFLIVAFFAYVERDHLYVRDFRASVTRNGVQESNAQVFFNRHNDVLLENDVKPLYITLIQHGQPIGVPEQLNCIHFFICLVAKEGAIIQGSDGGAKLKSMTPTGVSYRDDLGQSAVVTFR